MVVFIDTLGYGALLEGKPMLLPEHLRNIENENIPFKYLEHFQYLFSQVFNEDLGANLKWTGFSDALFIVLESSNNTNLNYQDVFTLCLKLGEFLKICIENYIPIRGGISFGRIRASEGFGNTGMNYLAGLAVKQAVTMEEIQEWVGVSFIPPLWIKQDDQTRYCQMLSWLEARDTRTVKRWDVPTKRGIVATYAITCETPISLIRKLVEHREYEKNRERPSTEDCKYRGAIQFLKNLLDEEMEADELTCPDIIRPES